MKHLYVCLISLFLITTSHAQQRRLHGFVRDALKKQGIPFASLVIKGTNLGAQTNEEGQFELSLPSGQEVTLIVFQLGYETQESIVKPEENELILLLKPKSFMLEGVEVVSKKVEILQEQNNVEYLAFDFYDNLLLALVNKGGRNNHVQILRDNGELILERPAPAGAEQLFKDCFGNIHLLGADSSWQVYYDYENLHYLKPYTRMEFRIYLEPCQCAYGDYYYFKNKRYRKLKDLYFYIHRSKPTERQLLRVVADSAAIRAFNEDYNLQYFLQQRRIGGGYATSVDEIKKHIDTYREQLPLSVEYEQAMTAARSEMVRLDSSILIFDFTNAFVFHYQVPGSLAQTKPVEHLQSFKTEVLVDPDRKSIFLRKEKDGYSYLMRYDASRLSGFNQELKIEKFSFLNNVRIRGGYAYFLYRDRLGGKALKIHKYLLPSGN